MRSFDQIAQAASRLMESGELELGDSVASQPVQSYLDPVTFEREVGAIVRSRPIPWIASSKIAKPGDFITGEVIGSPLLGVRGEDGRARVFLNVCRHRGAKLATESCGEGRKELVCPFHGWAYGLDGRLSRMASQAQCFNQTGTKGFALKEVSSREFAGMIWIVLDGVLGESEFSWIERDFPALGFVPALPFDESESVRDFNWKLGVEAFLEVYHFPYAHAPYLEDLAYPNLCLSDDSGENARMVVPLEKPEPGQGVVEWAQVMYFVFPATFLLFYDDHVALISILPEGQGRTRFRYLPLVPTEIALASETVAERVGFLKTILAQDLEILEGVQNGLRSGANARMTFTRLEHALARFHRDLERSVARPLSFSP